jgi:MacB-like periplasmic core domain
VAQVREEVRDVWLTRWLRDFAYDLRFSWRSYVRTPSFSITAVLSLMLGIGATTAIYSLVDQVLLHALPVRQPDRLVLFDWRGNALTNGFGTWNLMSYPICRDLDQQKRFFEGVFCRALTNVNLSTGGDRPAEVEVEVVSGNYFRVLGVPAALGRVFDYQDDGAPNSNPVVVLSYGFWEKQMGGAPDVAGRKVLVNQHPMTVIGVAAPSFEGIDIGMVPSLWIPASMSSQVYLPKNPAANALQSGLDSRLLLFAFFASVTAGISCGLAPAWQAGRRSVAASLRERVGTAGTSVRLRKIIVTAQIALTLILLLGAALFVRTLDALMTKGPGFATTSMISFALDPMRNG